MIGRRVGVDGGGKSPKLEPRRHQKDSVASPPVYRCTVLTRTLRQTARKTVDLSAPARLASRGCAEMHLQPIEHRLRARRRRRQGGRRRRSSRRLLRRRHLGAHAACGDTHRRARPRTAGRCRPRWSRRRYRLTRRCSGCSPSRRSRRRRRRPTRHPPHHRILAGRVRRVANPQNHHRSHRRCPYPRLCFASTAITVALAFAFAVAFAPLLCLRRLCRLLLPQDTASAAASSSASVATPAVSTAFSSTLSAAAAESRRDGRVRRVCNILVGHSSSRQGLHRKAAEINPVAGRRRRCVCVGGTVHISQCALRVRAHSMATQPRAATHAAAHSPNVVVTLSRRRAGVPVGGVGPVVFAERQARQSTRSTSVVSVRTQGDCWATELIRRWIMAVGVARGRVPAMLESQGATTGARRLRHGFPPTPPPRNA